MIESQQSVQSAYFRLPEFQVVILVEYNDNELDPLTVDVPKCLLPLANRSILEYQLDFLTNCGVTEIFIATPSEYKQAITLFLSNQNRKNVHDPVEYGENEDGVVGSANGLRALAAHIRGDFICISTDSLCLFPLGILMNFHRSRNSDVTITLASAPVDSPSTKGAKPKLKIDRNDHEFIGMGSDGRLALKFPHTDPEGSISFSKPLLHRCQPLNIRHDIVDMGVYVMARWTLDCLLEESSISSVRDELLPFLIKRQFQSAKYLRKEIPSISNKKPILEASSFWASARSTVCTVPSSLELVDIVAQKLNKEKVDLSRAFHEKASISAGESASATAEDDDDDVEKEEEGPDLLQLFAILFESNASVGSTATTGTAATATAASSSLWEDSSAPIKRMKDSSVLFRRIGGVDAYLDLNREILLRAQGLTSKTAGALWASLQGYKKQTVVGEGSSLGLKSAATSSSVGNNCSVGASTSITGSVVMDGARIGDKCKITNCIIGPGAVVENGCTLSEFCILGAGTVVREGTTLVKAVLSADDEEDDEADDDDCDDDEEEDGEEEDEEDDC